LQLLSILRLSQALARLRFSDFVATEDVDEAIRITHQSKASLLDNQTARGGSQEDVTSRIFGIIRDYNNSVKNRAEVEFGVCEAMVLRKGFTVEQVRMDKERSDELTTLALRTKFRRTQILFYFSYKMCLLRNHCNNSYPHNLTLFTHRNSLHRRS